MTSAIANTTSRCPARALGVALAAAATLVAPAEASETRRVMAGRPGYDTSAFHNFFMAQATEGVGD
jgi:hypothetical protein